MISRRSPNGGRISHKTRLLARFLLTVTKRCGYFNRIHQKQALL